MQLIIKYLFLLLLCTNASFGQQCLSTKEFPKDFLFGTASSAYQIEGAWNVNGKGESIWDRYTHTLPDKIQDRSTGDTACNAYYNTKQDVALLKDMGINFYRFSLSWTRILPTGFLNRINPDGIRYYNELIDELLANGITPMVTLYHWDLPQSLQDLGGFTNRIVVEHFENYARVAFENFGDRVKLWLTFNEPKMVCRFAYSPGFSFAPGLENSTGIGEYLCAHNLLLAHAKVYRLYDKRFRPNQRGRIGITMDSEWYEPLDARYKMDREAAERLFEFALGWFANPIFSKHGDYPAIMKRRIYERSVKEGYQRSRLPEFTLEEIASLRGSADFFGYNHYTSFMVTDEAEAPGNTTNSNNDMRVKLSRNDSWPMGGISWLYINPEGLRKSLKYIKETYNNPPIFITENGYGGLASEGTHDPERISYLKGYISAVLDAIHLDGVNVKAYTAWSFLDDFEWNSGYAARFGLIHIDFNDPQRKRSPKTSVQFYKQLIRERSLKNSKFVNPQEICSAKRKDDTKKLPILWQPSQTTNNNHYGNQNNNYRNNHRHYHSRQNNYRNYENTTSDTKIHKRWLKIHNVM